MGKLCGVVTKHKIDWPTLMPPAITTAQSPRNDGAATWLVTKAFAAGSLTRNPEYQSICPVMKSNYANEKPVKQSTIDVVSTNGEAYDVKA